MSVQLSDCRSSASDSAGRRMRFYYLQYLRPDDPRCVFSVRVPGESAIGSSRDNRMSSELWSTPRATPETLPVPSARCAALQVVARQPDVARPSRTTRGADDERLRERGAPRADRVRGFPPAGFGDARCATRNGARYWQGSRPQPPYHNPVCAANSGSVRKFFRTRAARVDVIIARRSALLVPML